MTFVTLRIGTQTTSGEVTGPTTSEAVSTKVNSVESRMSCQEECHRHHRYHPDSYARCASQCKDATSAAAAGLALVRKVVQPILEEEVGLAKAAVNLRCKSLCHRKYKLQYGVPKTWARKRYAKCMRQCPPSKPTDDALADATSAAAVAQPALDAQVNLVASRMDPCTSRCSKKHPGDPTDRSDPSYGEMRKCLRACRGRRLADDGTLDLSHLALASEFQQHRSRVSQICGKKCSKSAKSELQKCLMDCSEPGHHFYAATSDAGAASALQLAETVKPPSLALQLDKCGRFCEEKYLKNGSDAMIVCLGGCDIGSSPECDPDNKTWSVQIQCNQTCLKDVQSDKDKFVPICFHGCVCQCDTEHDQCGVSPSDHATRGDQCQF